MRNGPLFLCRADSHRVVVMMLSRYINLYNGFIVAICAVE